MSKKVEVVKPRPGESVPTLIAKMWAVINAPLDAELVLDFNKEGESVIAAFTMAQFIEMMHEEFGATSDTARGSLLIILFELESKMMMRHIGMTPNDVDVIFERRDAVMRLIVERFKQS